MRAAGRAPALGLALAAGTAWAAAAGAQEGRLSLGSVRTDAEARAVRIAAEYLSNLGPLFRGSGAPAATGAAGWWLLVRPEAQLLTGDEDAFDGVVVKLTGNYARFRAKRLPPAAPGQAPGPWVMDWERSWLAVPVSAGMESDGAFRRVNALAEVGVVPIFPGQFRGTTRYRVGAFLQGGYKFRADGAEQGGGGGAAADGGGAADESEEAVESALARAKLDARLDVPIRVARQLSLRLIGNGSGWYDLVNTTTYFRVEGILRIPLARAQHFDLTYERGSGAPNFNRGEQFSANLTIAF